MHYVAYVPGGIRIQRTGFDPLPIFLEQDINVLDLSCEEQLLELRERIMKMVKPNRLDPSGVDALETVR